MASSTYQQQPFPAVPPSMSAGEHEMRDYHASQDAPRPTTNKTPDFKPYLGLRARLSQIWINRWTILLLLVLVRLLFAFASTDSSLRSARREALGACTHVENMGSSMASMPHYMAQGANEMTASGVEKAVSGLVRMLEMSVSGVEGIVLFVINMMTSTYLCLITLAVKGGIAMAVALGEEITKAVEKVTSEVAGGIGNGIKEITEAYDNIRGKINNIPGVDLPQVPNLDDEIGKIQGFKVPPEMMDRVRQFEKEIPDFKEIQEAADNVIKIPFEKVKELIRKMDDDFKFDRSLLPVPQKEKLNFCSEGNSINDFFDDLIKMVYHGKKIALAVLIVAAVLVCAPMAWQEIRRYRKMQERAALADEGHDAMDVVYLASRPTSSGIGLWFGRRFGSARRQAIIRWAWAYATSTPMLFLLSLGAAGLFSCLCQYIMLKSIEDKVPDLTQQVADFAGKVLFAVNNASMSWSTSVNGVIDDMDENINQEVFGWVNDTTEALNDTINVFVDKMSQTLDGVFGKTPFKDAIKNVLDCLIGLKVQKIQDGLTWVKDNAHVSFPGVRNDTFSLAALAEHSDSDSAADLLADPTGKAKDEVTEAITYVIEKMMSGIETEALISTALIVLWLLITIGGYIYATVHLVRRDPYSDRAYHIDPATISEPKPQVQVYDAAAAPPSYVANDYNVNKAAPYTLNSRPFPTFDAEEDESEKVGQVSAHREVNTSSRPGHLRASSHGDLADPSPLDERTNPFSDRFYPREK